MKQLYEEWSLHDDMLVEEREVKREKHFTVGKGLEAYSLQIPLHKWESQDLMSWSNSPLGVLGDSKLPKLGGRVETGTIHSWLSGDQQVILFQVKCGSSRDQIFLETPVHVLTLKAFSGEASFVDAATSSCWLLLNSLCQDAHVSRTQRKWGIFSCRERVLLAQQTAPQSSPMVSSLPLWEPTMFHTCVSKMISHSLIGTSSFTRTHKQHSLCAAHRPWSLTASQPGTCFPHGPAKGKQWDTLLRLQAPKMGYHSTERKSWRKAGQLAERV